MSPSSRSWQINILVALVILLTSVYLFTYNGRIESGDTLSLFDATGSLARHGDLLLDRSAWFNPPLPETPGHYGLSTIEVEPLQIILAAPLYWLGYHLPGVGLVHTVWLFNIVVSAALGLVMYGCARTLGYGNRTAIVAALLLGLATIIWPYSKTFFREPLAALLLLLSVLFTECWRGSQYRSRKALIGLMIAVVGGLLTKEAIILAAPALLVLLIPAFSLRGRWRRLPAVIAIVGFVLAGMFILISLLTISVDLTPLYTQIASLLRRRPAEIATIHRALHSYLLSIGGSVWGTSPILLLAIPGLWSLYRRGQYRYPAALLLILVTFAVSYALLRGPHWFGGLSWPPRFLLPVIPVLMLGTLPTLDRLLNQPVRRVWFAGFALLAGYSVWIQVSGVTLGWGAYTASLPQQANGLSEWGGGLNLIEYLRWVVVPSLWTTQALDFAWVRTNAALWPVGCVALAGVSGFWLWQCFRHVNRHTGWRVPVALSIITLALAYANLRGIYYDELYLGNRQPLHDMLPIIQANAQPNDVLLLADNNYEPFIQNYGKFSTPRVISLPDQPGERHSPDEPPQIESSNPDALLVKSSIPLIHRLAGGRSRLWLLADSGPWIPTSIRPVERFLTAHYYPIQELSTDATVRLIEYSTRDAPNPFAFGGPQTPSDLVYGNDIQLTGFTLPLRSRYQPGDLLDISLYWQAKQRPDRDYTVAWFLADESGSPVAQGFDYQPAWGFAPTSGWLPGVPLWDNRALHIPDSLAPGTYQLWVRVYAANPDGSLDILPVSGTTILEGSIGVLPVAIDIVP